MILKGSLNPDSTSWLASVTALDHLKSFSWMIFVGETSAILFADLKINSYQKLEVS